MNRSVRNVLLLLMVVLFSCALTSSLISSRKVVVTRCLDALGVVVVVCVAGGTRSAGGRSGVLKSATRKDVRRCVVHCVWGKGVTHHCPYLATVTEAPPDATGLATVESVVATPAELLGEQADLVGTGATVVVFDLQALLVELAIGAAAEVATGVSLVETGSRSEATLVATGAWELTGAAASLVTSWLVSL